MPTEAAGPGTGTATGAATATIRGVSPRDLDNWFQYHAPKPEQQKKYEAIREAGKELAAVILTCTPPGPDQTAAAPAAASCPNARVRPSCTWRGRNTPASTIITFVTSSSSGKVSPSAGKLSAACCALPESARRANAVPPLIASAACVPPVKGIGAARRLPAPLARRPWPLSHRSGHAGRCHRQNPGRPILPLRNGGRLLPPAPQPAPPLWRTPRLLRRSQRHLHS